MAAKVGMDGHNITVEVAKGNAVTPAAADFPKKMGDPRVTMGGLSLAGSPELEIVARVRKILNAKLDQ